MFGFYGASPSFNSSLDRGTLTTLSSSGSPTMQTAPTPQVASGTKASTGAYQRALADQVAGPLKAAAQHITPQTQSSVDAIRGAAAKVVSAGVYADRAIASGDPAVVRPLRAQVKSNLDAADKALATLLAFLTVAKGPHARALVVPVQQIQAVIKQTGRPMQARVAALGFGSTPKTMSTAQRAPGVPRAPVTGSFRPAPSTLTDTTSQQATGQGTPTDPQTGVSGGGYSAGGYTGGSATSGSAYDYFATADGDVSGFDAGQYAMDAAAGQFSYFDQQPDVVTDAALAASNTGVSQASTADVATPVNETKLPWKWILGGAAALLLLGRG